MHTLLAQIDVQFIISIAIVGLIAGALARFLIPGRQPMNLIFTMLLGIVGAFVGGYIASVTGIGGQAWYWNTLILPTAGAIIVLLAVMFLQGLMRK